jgi:hypothetical protein
MWYRKAAEQGEAQKQYLRSLPRAYKIGSQSATPRKLFNRDEIQLPHFPGCKATCKNNINSDLERGSTYEDHLDLFNNPQ